MLIQSFGPVLSSLCLVSSLLQLPCLVVSRKRRHHESSPSTLSFIGLIELSAVAFSFFFFFSPFFLFFKGEELRVSGHRVYISRENHPSRLVDDSILFCRSRVVRQESFIVNVYANLRFASLWAKKKLKVKYKFDSSFNYQS